MKAIIHSKYGPPAVAKLMEVDKPMPNANELLVKVYASTVNRTDAGFRSAEYFISRFWSGLLKPKYQTLGCEFAGIIEATGKEVTAYTIGDKIFGFNDKTFGGHAEYLTISEDAAITTMPANISFAEAAAITEGAHYALGNIRAAKVKSDQKVMVYGATGAIGSAALQLLKAMDVHVTAVCNTKNINLIKTLGADVVFNYETDNISNLGSKFHFIFDAVGKLSFKKIKPLLTDKGIYISTELGKKGENIFLSLFTPFLGGKKVLFPLPSSNKADVIYLKDLVENKLFKPVIDRCYNMEEIVQAYKYVESGHKTGNVILKII